MNISEEAAKLIVAINERDERVNQDNYSLNDFLNWKKGGISKDDIYPLLEELIEAKLLKASKGVFSLPKRAKSKIEDLEAELTNIYTEEYKEALEAKIKKYSKFVVTTAVVDKEVNKDFVKSIRNYAERNNALVLVLPCEDVVSRGKKKSKYLNFSEDISDFSIVFKDLKLCDDFTLYTIKVSAKQINPLTGLDRIATRMKSSLVVGSTKQFMKYVPNMHYDIPLAVMTTGAITENNYDTDRYMSKRTSSLAEKDHAYGAVVVEITNKGKALFRHVKASENNAFTDLGMEYLPDGSINKLTNNVLVLGDSHTGYHDLELFVATVKLAHSTSVENLVLHDIFDGSSISHHDWGKSITKYLKVSENKLTLEEECTAVKRYLEAFLDQGFKLSIVDSNHDNHLFRYLDEGRFVNDYVNYKFSIALTNAVLNGSSPLQHAVEKVGLESDNVKWLKIDESYCPYGVELSMHGHVGANGAKGSVVSYDRSIGNCVSAHTHTAAIVRDSYSVGTSSSMDLGYNKGLSNWTHTCCLVHSNGTKQLITFSPVVGGYIHKV